MRPFIEVILDSVNDPTNGAVSWQDHSDATHFIFTSAFGRVQLQKRTAWPLTYAFVEHNRLYAGYGDYAAARHVSSKQLFEIPEEQFYDNEFLLLSMDCARRTLDVQRDALSTVPLFIRSSPTRFVASSRYENVYSGFSAPPAINTFALATLLLGHLAPGETLAADIVQLYDRQRLHWSRKGSEIIYPPNGSMVAVTDADRKADPHQFRTMLESTIERYWQRYGSNTIVGTELSCGFDSSAVNGYLALKKYPCYITSISYHDTYQQAFLRRLAAFSKSFKIKSHLIPMLPEEDFPLAPIVQNSTWHPFESSYELYASSVTKQADYLHRKGATVLFQGTGGDELFENIPDLNAEKPLGAYFSRTNMVPDYMQPRFGDFITNAVTQHHQQVCPIPLLSNSVATTGNTTNTILLERGIWPVMPLADARLYVYCQHLPIEYRMKRNLMRAYLLARGHPVQTHTPQRNEDFGQFFKDAAPKGLAPIFSTLLQDSVLGNAGLVDMDAADREWQLAASRGAETVSTPIFTLYCLLIAEINARFLDTTDLY